jgi:hypothetical protein
LPCEGGECARTWGIPKWFAHLLVATITCFVYVLHHHGPNPNLAKPISRPAVTGPHALDIAVSRVGARSRRAGEGEDAEKWGNPQMVPATYW